MKRLRLAAAAVLIGILSVGASVWEGAAAVSISGELPEGGYYVATKSFPRNTVVDITNLESSKTVRAIVATGLDSPGLLAILSRDAADTIGIQPRSVGRIRITMPADPIAFSRFTEGAVPRGDPDHNPQAAIAGIAPRQAAPQKAPQSAPQGGSPQGPQAAQEAIIPPGTMAAPGTIPPVVWEEPGTIPPVVWEEPDPPSPLVEWSQDPPAPGAPAGPVTGSIIPPGPLDSPPNTVLWPWEQPDPSLADRLPAMNPALPGGPASGSGYPVEIPGEISLSRSTAPDYGSSAEDPFGMRPPEEAGYGSSPAPYVAGGPGEPDYGSPPDPFLAGDTAYDFPAAPFMDAGPGETPPVIPPPESAYRPPAAAQADNAIAYERGPALTGERGVANLAAAAVPKSIVMEPAEERPPEPSIPMLPPEAEIAPIPPRVNPPAAPKTGPVEIPEAYILPEIAAAPRSRPVPETAKPEPVRAEPVSPGVEDAAPDRTADVQFSAPLITTLEKGKYYLQLRAYTKTDLVELELTRLGSGYPLAVQAGESQEKPLYRILVGPMNLGETNALLRRFKGNGYNDAFVKKGE